MPLQLSTAVEGSGPVVDSVAVGTSSGQRQIIAIGSLSSTDAGSTAVTIGSVALLGGSSGNTLGNVTVSNSLSVGSGSSGVVGTMLLSTGLTGAAIDPRLVTVQAGGSSINFGSVPAGSSSYSVGQVWQGSTFAVNLIAAGSSINVGVVPAGSSSYQVGTVYIGGGSTANTAGSVALLAGSSGNLIGSVALAAASTAVVHGAVAVSSGVILGAGSTGTLVGAVSVSSGVILAAGSTANSIGAVAVVAGTTAVIGGVQIAPGSTSTTVGSVALLAGSTATTVGTVGLTSSANEVQLTMNSTAYVNSNSFVSTGGAIGASEAMLSLRRVTNFSSGSSGTTFATSAIPFRLGPLTVSVYNSTNVFKTISLVLRGSTTSTGTSTNGSPLWNATFAPNAPSTLGQTNVGDTYSFPVSILAPSSMSFGFSAVASSSGNNLALCLCAEEVR